MSSIKESGVIKQDSTGIVNQAAVAPSLSTQPFTPPSQSPSANANERADLSQSHSLIDSRNLVITGGQFHHTLGHHTSLAIHINQGSPVESQSISPPLNENRNISPAQFSDPSSHSENRTRIEVDHERNQNQVSSQSQEISFQKSNDIYERHLILKGRGFPLWIPDPNQVLNLGYRRTGVRIGDVGIITDSGAFSFLFNICLPHNDPVNPRMLPEHFAPISPPIEATDIEKFKVFKNGNHLASSSVKISQTGTAISDIVFESSASEGAILTMPRGARSEKLGDLARFREYQAANIAHWYRFVNGPRGREAKNGDVRLVVGFDKTSSWGIATFANQTQQNSCHFKFGPSEGDSAYTWSEYSGVADVRAGPDSDEVDELRIDGDPPDIQFENQCLFVRTLNATLADDVWADIHSSSDSISVDPRNSQYPRVKNYSDSNRPHSNNPDNSSGFSLPQGVQSGTQRRLLDVDITVDQNPPIFVSGPVESIRAHPSKVLNDTLLARFPAAKMVITHDDDWSSVTQCSTLLNPHEFVATILASRDIYQQNGIVVLEPKKIILNENSEGSTSVNRAQEAAVVHKSPSRYVSPLMHNKTIQESFHSDQGKKYTESAIEDNLETVQKFRNLLVGRFSFDPDSSSELKGTYNSHEDPDASMIQLEEIDSDEFPDYFSELNGRLFPSALLLTPYPFPVDSYEQERVTLLHQILNRFIGAHYVGPVSDVLAPEAGRQKMALDLCTGNGKWVLDMAREFSHVHFRGMDIVPIATRYPPPRVQFEVHDVNSTYRWNDGTFDLVHARSVSMAVRDYPAILQEIARVLRPGGLFVSCELGRYAAFDPSFERVPSVDAPATVRFFDAITNALASRGIQPIAHQIPTFITNSGCFVDITVEQRCIPIGIWSSDVASQNIGADYLRVCKRYADSSKPLLLAAGWSEDTLERMITDYIQEIQTVSGLVEVLHTVHARRDWHESNPLEQSPSDSGGFARRTGVRVLGGATEGGMSGVSGVGSVLDAHPMDVLF